MTPDQIAAIRARHRKSHKDADEMQPQDGCDLCSLLSVLDAAEREKAEYARIVYLYAPIERWPCGIP